MYGKFFFVEGYIVLGNAPILCPLKTPENQRFSGVFRGYNMVTLAKNELIW